MSDIKYPPIAELEAMSDDELIECGVKKDKDGKFRNTKGHYLPGQTGQVKRGKLAKKAVKTPSKELSEFIPAEIREKYDADPLKCLQEMLRLAKTKQEAIRISKELLPYTNPKLAAVEQKTFNYHAGNLDIEWMGEDGFENIEDLTNSKLGDESVEDVDYEIVSDEDE